MTRLTPKKRILKMVLFASALMLALAAPVVIPPAQADIGTIAKMVPSASLVGKGRLTVLGFKVFDAALYAPDGAYSPARPFALKLTYLRNFKGSAISGRSAEEMRKQGASQRQLDKWTGQMSAIFPDVKAGQSITGIRTSAGQAVFFLGRRKIGTISDPAFAKRFFAIWLGNQTANPRLRAQLVGSGA